jgi:hypothetical protein
MVQNVQNKICPKTRIKKEIPIKKKLHYSLLQITIFIYFHHFFTDLYFIFRFGIYNIQHKIKILIKYIGFLQFN